MILYTHKAGLQIRYVRAHGCGMFHVHDLNPEKTISWCMSRVELFKLGLKVLWASVTRHHAESGRLKVPPPDYPWEKLNDVSQSVRDQHRLDRLGGTGLLSSKGVYWHCQGGKQCYKPSQCMQAEECLAGTLDMSIVRQTGVPLNVAVSRTFAEVDETMRGIADNVKM